MKWMQIIVTTTNPHGKESLRYYLNQMHQHYQRVGAKPLGKYRIDRVVVGIEKPEMVLVVEFARESAFREVFEGEGYQKLVPHRDKAFKKLSLLVSRG